MAKSKDPAFLFYYQDFLVGTTFMNLDEIGAYVLLLCHQADKKKLTIQEIKTVLGNNYEKIWPIIRQKFRTEGGKYYNERLSLEIKKRKEYADSRRNNRLSKKHMKNISKTYDLHMENENENRNRNEDVKRKKPKKKSLQKSGFNLQNEARLSFESFYLDKKKIKYYYDGTQAGALKMILSKIKSCMSKENPTDNEVLEAFKIMLVNIEDQFVLSNLDLTVINSQFNKVLAKIKNKNETTNGKGYKGDQANSSKWESVITEL